MAKRNNRQPRWLGPTTEHADNLIKAFKSNLRTVAIRLAKHERAEVVLDRHVDEAHDTLSRLGLSRRKWMDRPELEVSVGRAC